MTIRIGQLLIGMAADVARLQSDMTRATRVVDKAGADIRRTANLAAGALGAIGVALSGQALLGFAREALNVADNVTKMAQKVGIATKDLSGLGFAFSQGGVDMEKLQTTLGILSVNLSDFQKGTGEAKDAFVALGFSAKDFNGLPTGQVLLKLADSFAELEGGLGKATLAKKILGKAGLDLIPVFEQGSAGILELKRRADELGISFGQNAANAAEAFNDKLDELKQQLQGLAITALPPALKKFSDFIEQLREGTRIAGGFGNAILQFGILAPPGDPSKQIAEITEKLRVLEAARDRFAKEGKTTPGVLLGGIENDITRLKQQLEFAKVLQRQAAVGLLGSDFEDKELARFPRKKKAAPTLVDEAALKKAAAERLKNQVFIAEAIERGEEMAAQDVLEAQQALNEELNKLAEDHKKVREDAAQAIADAEVMAAEDVLEAQQALNEEQKKLADKQTTMKRIAEDLGFTFQSAFEDALLSAQKFGDVLRGLGQDILRIIARRGVTEPLAKGVSDVLAGIDLGKVTSSLGNLFGPTALQLSGPFASGGSFTVGGAGGTDSQNVAFRATPGELVTVTPPGQSALAGGGFTVVMNTQIDARGATPGVEVQLRRLLRETEERTVARIRNEFTRAGSLARIVGTA